MTFLTSGLAIAGACAIAIPIIIHLLFRQRRKPIEWGAMRFLLEAFRRHKKRLRLEQILLLAVRCLIPLLLGLALAQPLLQNTILATSAGNRAVYLIIDNGLVSGVLQDDHRSALQHQVDRAVGVVRELSAGDTVGIITAARPARGLLAPPSTDHRSVISLLESLQPDQSPSDLSGAFTVARGALDNSPDQRETMIYLLSEFRAGSVSLDSPPPAAVLDRQNVKLLAAPAAPTTIANTQMTSINPVRNLILADASDGSGQLGVRLARFGAQLGSEVTRVKLAGEGLSAIEPVIVNWSPGQAEATAEFHAGFNRLGDQGDGQIGLTASIDNDALNADNQRFIVLEARRKIRVLVIDRRSFGFERSLDQLTAGQWIRRALEPLASAGDSGANSGPMEIVEVEPAALDLADIRTADAAVLPRPDLLNDNGWSILKGFIQARGLLIVMPPAEANVHQWVEKMNTELNLSWPIALEPVDHPQGLALAEEQPATDLLRLISSELPELTRPVIVSRMLPVDRQALTTGQAQAVLTLSDGLPLLIAGTSTPASTSTGRSLGGMVMYLAVAAELSWSTLPSKPMMVPLFHELIRQGLGAIRGAQKYGVGEQPVIAAGAAAADLIGPRGEKIALDRAGRTQTTLMTAGLYGIIDQSGQPIGSIAVNIDPQAGRTDAQSQNAVNAWLAHAGTWETLNPEDFKSALGGVSNASHLAGVLLAAVLMLVLIETLLARWFSHAHAGEAVGSQPSVASESYTAGLRSESRKPMSESVT